MSSAIRRTVSLAGRGTGSWEGPASGWGWECEFECECESGAWGELERLLLSGGVCTWWGREWGARWVWGWLWRMVVAGDVVSVFSWLGVVVAGIERISSGGSWSESARCLPLPLSLAFGAVRRAAWTVGYLGRDCWYCRMLSSISWSRSSCSFFSSALLRLFSAIAASCSDIFGQ